MKSFKMADEISNDHAVLSTTTHVTASEGNQLMPQVTCLDACLHVSIQYIPWNMQRGWLSLFKQRLVIRVTYSSIPITVAWLAREQSYGYPVKYICIVFLVWCSNCRVMCQYCILINHVKQRPDCIMFHSRVTHPLSINDRANRN